MRVNFAWTFQGCWPSNDPAGWHHRSAAALQGGGRSATAHAILRVFFLFHQRKNTFDAFQNNQIPAARSSENQTVHKGTWAIWEQNVIDVKHKCAEHVPLKLSNGWNKAQKQKIREAPVIRCFFRLNTICKSQKSSKFCKKKTKTL